MDNLLILGAGAFGQTVKECAQDTNLFQSIDFLDDNNPVAIGKCSEFANFFGEYKCAFAAFGDNALRAQYIEKLLNAGFDVPVLIHSKSYVSKSAKLGSGTIILPQSAVGANTVLGNGCIINLGTIVDHDCTLEAGVHLAPGVVVKARNNVPCCEKLDSGTVLL